METCILVIMVVAIATIIALGVYHSLKKTILIQEKKISVLRSQVEALQKDKEALTEREKILKELIIISEIGYRPSEEERKNMIFQLLDDIRFIKTDISKRTYYRTEGAREATAHLNRIGKELIEIYDSLKFSLSESISEKRSLYQELIDYICFRGFNFCGKKAKPERTINDSYISI